MENTDSQMNSYGTLAEQGSKRRKNIQTLIHFLHNKYRMNASTKIGIKRTRKCGEEKSVAFKKKEERQPS